MNEREAEQRHGSGQWWRGGQVQGYERGRMISTWADRIGRALSVSLESPFPYNQHLNSLSFISSSFLGSWARAGVVSVNSGADLLGSQPSFCTHLLWDLWGRLYQNDLCFSSLKEKFTKGPRKVYVNLLEQCLIQRKCSATLAGVIFLARAENNFGNTSSSVNVLYKTWHLKNKWH